MPDTRSRAVALLREYRPRLVSDERTREVARLVLHQPAPSLIMTPVQTLVMRAAVDLLPDWARAMHGLHASRLQAPLVRGASLGIAETLRWAFASGYRR